MTDFNLTNDEAISVLKWHVKNVFSPVIREAIEIGIHSLVNEENSNSELRRTLFLDSLRIGTVIYYLSDLNTIIEDFIDNIYPDKDGVLIFTTVNKSFSEKDINKTLFFSKELLLAELSKNERIKDVMTSVYAQEKERIYKESQELGISTIIKSSKLKSLEQEYIDYMDQFDRDGDGYSDGHEIRNGTSITYDDAIER